MNVLENFIWEGLDAVRFEVERTARLRITILLTGESGTGKTQIAELLHAMSGKKESCFRKVVCPAIPHELFESELFGHKKGAFTGAALDRDGEVSFAEGGTLFLEEVGELSLYNQAKLLAFLDDRKYRRVGDTVIKVSNARIVCATHRVLRKEVAERRFMEPLYYRLRGHEISVPPLRERRAAIPKLVEAFVASRHADYGHAAPPQVAADAMQALKRGRFPGNVRDLECVLGSALIRASGHTEVALADVMACGLKVADSDAPPIEHAETPIVADSESHELLNWIDKIAQGLQGFQSVVSKSLEFGQAVRYMAYHLIRHLNEQRTKRPDAHDLGMTLFSAPRREKPGSLGRLTLPEEWGGFDVMVFSLAVAIRWDLAVNHAEEDSLSAAVLAKRYCASFGKSNQRGALYPRVAGLLLSREQQLASAAEDETQWP